MDEDFSERFKALRRDIRDVQEDLEALRKKKANGEDVEQIAKKVSDIESEMRNRFASLQSGNSEIIGSVRKLTEAVEQLRSEVANQKNQFNTLQETNKGSVWARIPLFAWILMAVGIFAVLQLGLDRWAEIQRLGH